MVNALLRGPLRATMIAKEMSRAATSITVTNTMLSEIGQQKSHASQKWQ
jgi:hypothetical protein